MAKILELYKCDICKNVVEVVHSGEGELVCCGEVMENLKENIPNIENAHYAFVEKLNDTERKIVIKHPMTPEHHIEFIEAISNDEKYIKRKYLKENEPAEMIIKCNCKEGFYVRLYCNLDGVWKTTNALGEN